MSKGSFVVINYDHLSIAWNGQNVEVSAVQRTFFDSGESGQRQCADPGVWPWAKVTVNLPLKIILRAWAGHVPDTEPYRSGGGLDGSSAVLWVQSPPATSLMGKEDFMALTIINSVSIVFLGVALILHYVIFHN